MSGSVWYISVSKKKIEFKRYPKKPRKTTKKKNFMIGFLFLTALISLSGLISAAAINDTFHINLQTTYSNGSIQNGTFTFAFNITESSNASCLTPVVYNHSTSLTTDSRGIVSIYLPTSGSGGGNLSTLDFDKQYYLCYYRDGSLKDVSQLGRVPYSFRATQVNLSEVTVDANLTLGSFNISANYGFFGDANATGTIYAQRNKNLSIGYDYSLNGSLWTLNYSDYLAIRDYALNDSRWTLNYSNFTVVYGYAINDSLWTLNYSTYLLKPTYAQVTNGTDVALVTAANTFGNFNQTFNGTTLFLWALTNRIGIGTTSPMNTLNVVGDANATGTIYAQRTKNLSIGYDYATNGSFIGSTNATYGYSLNASLWTLNYTNFSNVYAMEYNNSLRSGTNNSFFGTFNLSNATGYQVISTDAMGNVTIGRQTPILFINAVSNRTGIGTTSPQNTLNVIGDINATTDIWARRTLNLTSGYLYATNGTYYLASNPSGYVSSAVTSVGGTAPIVSSGGTTPDIS